MKALITYPYNDPKERYEEINTLQDLILLRDKEKNPLIIEDNPACKDYDFVILVYSGYIE